MAERKRYEAGMTMHTTKAAIRVDGVWRNVSNFSISDGVAKGRVSGREVETVCRIGERISEIKRRLVIESGTRPMTPSERISYRNKMQTYINGHHITDCHTENNYDGTVTVTGYVDDEFTSIRFKAASLDEQGKLHHGKPWLRAAREGLVEEYERNHKTTSIVTYRAEKKANVGLAMCNEDFRDALVAKGVQRNGIHYTYLNKTIHVGDNITQFEVMNQIKEINIEINDEVAEFFRSFGA